MLKNYAKYNGLQYPEFSHSDLNAYNFGELRGYKVLKDNTGKEIEVTYEVKAHFGNNSGDFLVGSSPSIIFPTPEIVKFFGSLKKNNKK